LSSKASRVKLSPSSCIVISTPGAGGYGAPGKREAEALTQDQLSGKYTKAFMAEHYAKKD